MSGGGSSTSGAVGPSAAGQAYDQVTRMNQSIPYNENLYNLLPEYSAFQHALMANPGAPGAQAGAQTASGMGQNIANQAYSNAGGLSALSGLYGAQVPGLINNANDLYNLGRDPENALYNRTAQRVQDQLRAANAAAGVQSSPYGAGLEGQGMENFNIDWQNNMLQRALSGAQGAEGMFSTAAGLGSLSSNLDTSALSLGQGASSLYDTSAGLPYETNKSIYTDALGGLDAYSKAAGNAFAQQQGGLQSLLSYIQTMIGQQGQNLSSGQASFGNLGSILGAATSGLGLLGL